MEHLKIGAIIDSYKLDGSMKVFITTDKIDKRFHKGNEVFLSNKNGEIISSLTITNFSQNGNTGILKVNEINTPEQVKEYKGYELIVNKSDKDLDKNEYYFVDLVGCKLIDENNIDRGIVISIEEFPAQPTLKVKGNQKTYYFPFVKAFIRSVDLENKIINIIYLVGIDQ